ncbi:MAG TPA: cobalamin-binding protein [Pyrinomonadaceae bacterium]|jgi:iron complex transport system substrate-binding protein
MRCRVKEEIAKWTLLGAILLALGACRSAGSGVQPATRVVIDDLGRQMTVPAEIKRVVSLAPSVTESIFAVGAGDKLVGDTTYCNYPEQAKAIAKVGDTMNPNMETIVALKPDIVLVSTASQIEAFTKTLERNGIAVFVMNPQSLSDVLKQLGRLGELLGTAGSANSVVKQLQDRELRVCDTFTTCSFADVGGPRVKISGVFIQISREPLFTIGKDSFLNQVIDEAGGKSVTADVETAFPKLSKETASALNPDVIILSDSEDNQEPNEAFKNSPAVKNGRVYKINADIISRPGPRLVDALEQIAKDLHPDRF